MRGSSWQHRWFCSRLGGEQFGGHPRLSCWRRILMINSVTFPSTLSPPIPSLFPSLLSPLPLLHSPFTSPSLCSPSLLSSFLLDHIKLCATLRTRLNLMCETETPSPELPSRIVARIPISRSKPVARNSILLCDYVTSDESVRETHERFQALLALDLPKPASVDGTDIGLVFREDSAPLVPQQNSQKTQQPNSEKNPNHNLQEKQVQLNIQQKGFLLPMVVAVVVAFVSVVLFLMQK